MGHKADNVLVQLSIHLPAIITKKESWFVASCPVLDVVSQGPTLEKAKANLSEALSLFFISCFERGTLDAVLKSCGFKPVHESIHKIERDRSDYIDVPLPFMIDMGNPQRCHA